MADEARGSKVGDRHYPIARFRGLKAQWIMREVGALGRRFPRLLHALGDFEKDYSASHAVRMERTRAELEFGAAAREISEEAWASTDNSLPMGRMPQQREKALALWPDVIEVAEEPVLNLLAVLSMSNEELAEADDADDVAAAIKARRKELLHNGEPLELVDLALAGWEVCREQFGPLVERLEGQTELLLGLLGLPTMGEREQTESSTTSTSSTQSSESSATSDESSPASSPGETKPSSSTDSLPPTDGTETRSSSAPPGERSEPALTG